MTFMDLMTSSVNLLKGTTQQSTDAMAERLQELLMVRLLVGEVTVPFSTRRQIPESHVKKMDWGIPKHPPTETTVSTPEGFGKITSMCACFCEHSEGCAVSCPETRGATTSDDNC